jgi:hypothetical protein
MQTKEVRMIDDYRTFSFRRAVVAAVLLGGIFSIVALTLSIFMGVITFVTTLLFLVLDIFSFVALPHAVASIVDILFLWSAYFFIGFVIACILGVAAFFLSSWAINRLPSEWQYAYWRSAALRLARKYPVLESDAKDIACRDIGTIQDWTCELARRRMPGLPGRIWNGIYHWLDKNVPFLRKSGENWDGEVSIVSLDQMSA